MNYIKQLQKEKEIAEKKILAAIECLDSFKLFLHSSKFTGLENGERKDWIATDDVLNWIEQTKNEILDDIPSTSIY